MAVTTNLRSRGESTSKSKSNRNKRKQFTKPDKVQIKYLSDVITVRQASELYNVPYNSLRLNVKMFKFYSRFGLARKDSKSGTGEDKGGVWLLTKQALDDYYQQGEYYDSENSLWDNWSHLRRG